MKHYPEKYNDPRRYVRDAECWLNDAEHALQLFDEKATPKTESDENNCWEMKDYLDNLKKLIRQHQSTVAEITYGLPDVAGE